MTQHTPGPWRNDPADGALILAERQGALVSIAEVFYVDDEQAPNARLIAAAPEMLHALRTIAGSHYESAQYARDMTRALLARIEGKE